MAYDLKKIMAEKPSRFTEGHRMCAGCGAPVVARMVLRALKPEDHAVIANATGCRYDRLYLLSQVSPLPVRDTGISSGSRKARGSLRQ